MTTPGAGAGTGVAEAPSARARAPERGARWTGAVAAGVVIVVLVGALTLFFAFQDGGYYPGSTGVGVVVLAAFLAARSLLARDPFAGRSALLAVAAGALVLLAVWTLVSAGWSQSPARATFEFDRVLLYLLTLVAVGSLARHASTARHLVWGLALAMGAVCVIAFVTRTFPDVWSAPAEFQRNRLSYPIGYWNALGLMASLALVFCLHLASSAREPRVVRVLGAAGIPVIASTLVFTFSRGPLAVAVVGLLAYLILGRPRLAVTGLVAAAPTAALAVIVTYQTDFSAEFVKGRGYAALTADGLAEAHDVGLTVALCALAAGLVRLLGALVVDPALTRLRLGRRTRRGLAVAVGALALVAVLVGSFAATRGDWLDRQYDRLTRDPVTQTGDYRDRLSNPGLATRTDRWGAALEAFAEDRVKGQGAGTYQLEWERRRATDSDTVEAHSLYLEMLGELGVIGLLLLAVVLACILGGLALRARGADRAPYAALLAAGLVWAIHAAVDWDWELPALTLWLFAAGGVALAARAEGSGAPEGPARPAVSSRPEGSQGRATGWPLRIGIVVALGIIALTPVRVALSEQRLADAVGAYGAGDCGSATASAESSRAAFGDRPGPYEVVAFCAARNGDARRAIDLIGEAVERDPGNWRYRYDLALLRAHASADPRAAAAAARALNPREAAASELVVSVASDRPAAWRRAARRIGLAPPGR